MDKPSGPDRVQDTHPTNAQHPVEIVSQRGCCVRCSLLSCGYCASIAEIPPCTGAIAPQLRMPRGGVSRPETSYNREQNSLAWVRFSCWNLGRFFQTFWRICRHKNTLSPETPEFCFGKFCHGKFWPEYRAQGFQTETLTTPKCRKWGYRWDGLEVGKGGIWKPKI